MKDSLSFYQGCKGAKDKEIEGLQSVETEAPLRGKTLHPYKNVANQVWVKMFTWWVTLFPWEVPRLTGLGHGLELTVLSPQTCSHSAFPRQPWDLARTAVGGQVTREP